MHDGQILSNKLSVQCTCNFRRAGWASVRAHPKCVEWMANEETTTTRRVTMSLFNSLCLHYSIWRVIVFWATLMCPAHSARTLVRRPCVRVSAIGLWFNRKLISWSFELCMVAELRECARHRIRMCLMGEVERYISYMGSIKRSTSFW